jgi:hypothetical protein
MKTDFETVGDSAAIINDKITVKFNESDPEAPGRSSEVVKERWAKMLATYRFSQSSLFKLMGGISLISMLNVYLVLLDNLLGIHSRNQCRKKNYQGVTRIKS